MASPLSALASSPPAPLPPARLSTAAAQPSPPTATAFEHLTKPRTGWPLLPRQPRVVLRSWVSHERMGAIETTTTPIPTHGTPSRDEKCNAKRAIALKTCRKNAVLPQNGSKSVCSGYERRRQRLEGGRTNELAVGAGCVLFAMEPGKTSTTSS